MQTPEGTAKFCVQCPDKRGYNGAISETNVSIRATWHEPHIETSNSTNRTEPGRYAFNVKFVDEVGSETQLIGFSVYEATDPALPSNEQSDQAAKIKGQLERSRQEFIKRIMICDGSGSGTCPGMDNIAVMTNQIIKNCVEPQ